MASQEKFLLAANIALYLFLAVFSFSYVDLNLTLSQNPLILGFVSTMQQLGYFARPVATVIYIAFLTTAFSFFIYNLWLFKKEQVGLSYLKKSTIINTLILIFAYPFLSYDFFNYLFDAKIILNYHQIPYTVRPLDFPNDEWLRFMHWTHRYSPYGPLWLGMSIIPALFGFGKFILNFFAFKIFIASFHLVNSFLIYRILQKLNPSQAIFQTAFYSLNPLFLIEGIANAHNDIVLTAFILLSIYFLVFAKTGFTYIALLAGTLIKYIPVLNMPWFLLASFKVIGTDRVILANFITFAIFTFVYSSIGINVPFVSSGATQIQFQPWYLFWTLPLVALLPRFNLLIISLAIALGASLRYLPYIYWGDWSHEGTIGFMQAITFLPAVLATIILAVKRTR